MLHAHYRDLHMSVQIKCSKAIVFQVAIIYIRDTKGIFTYSDRITYYTAQSLQLRVRKQTVRMPNNSNAEAPLEFTQPGNFQDLRSFSGCADPHVSCDRGGHALVPSTLHWRGRLVEAAWHLLNWSRSRARSAIQALLLPECTAPPSLCSCLYRPHVPPPLIIVVDQPA